MVAESLAVCARCKGARKRVWKGTTFCPACCREWEKQAKCGHDFRATHFPELSMCRSCGLVRQAGALLDAV